MTISKKIFAISIFIIIVFITLIARFAYNIGKHNASLAIKESTPLQIAQVMQSDNFYNYYAQTMLLVKGTPKYITHQDQDTIVEFETTKSPSALGKVLCDVKNNQTQINTGVPIRVLTVAHDAQRQKTADVFMPNCYLLK